MSYSVAGMSPVMVNGRVIAVTVMPVPGVKPLTPYSTVHAVASPFSVHVTESMLVSLETKVISVTGGHAGMASIRMSSTK